MANLQRNPDIIWRIEKRREKEVRAALEAGEEAAESGTVTLILSGMMHQLNFIGGMIWQLCDGTRDLESLVEDLAKEFEVERSVLRVDVEEFVADLAERGWLSRGE